MPIMIEYPHSVANRLYRGSEAVDERQRRIEMATVKAALPDMGQLVREAVHLSKGKLNPLPANASDVDLFRACEGNCTHLRDVLFAYLRAKGVDCVFPAYGKYIGLDARPSRARFPFQQHGWLQGHGFVVDPTFFVFLARNPAEVIPHVFVEAGVERVYDLGGFHLSERFLPSRRELDQRRGPENRFQLSWPEPLYGLLTERLGHGQWKQYGLHQEEIHYLCHLNPLNMTSTQALLMVTTLAKAGYQAVIPLDVQDFVLNGCMRYVQHSPRDFKYLCN